jgi:Uma2 family endonuclease
MVSTPEKPVAALPAEDAGGQYLDAREPGHLAQPICIHLPAAWTLTDLAFIELSQNNEPWKFETTEDGELLIVAGEWIATSELGVELIIDVGSWNRQAGGGHVLGPSGASRMSEKLIMIPDLSWVSNGRADRQDEEYGGVLLGICPEFVVEIRSESDSLKSQQERMERWIRYGALLGWLVDPQDEAVWIYRPDMEPEQLERPEQISGENVCEGLVVNFSQIWETSE